MLEAAAAAAAQNTGGGPKDARNVFFVWLGYAGAAEGLESEASGLHHGDCLVF